MIRRYLPALPWVLSVALIGWAIGLDHNAFFPATGDVWVNVGLALSYPGAGALILRYVPHHRIGWLTVTIGFASAIGLATHAYANQAIVANASGLPFGAAAAWLASWIWVLGAMPAIVFLPSLFPDGQPRGRAGRIAAVMGCVAIAGAAVGTALAPGRLVDFPSVRNPVGISGLGTVADGLSGVAFPLFLVAALLAFASAFGRWRSADVVVRRQLKWFAAATASFVVVVFVDASGLFPSYVNAVFAVIAPALTALAIVVAVLRYGLYEIDQIINRAAVYVTLTAVLVAVYAAGVSALGLLIGRLGGSVVTTGFVAIGFEPVRRRVQAGVDRALYGDRSAPDRVIEQLNASLADARSPEAAMDSVTRAIVDALGATGVQVAVTRDDELIASHVAGALDDSAVELALEHQARGVGTLTVCFVERSGARGRQDREMLERLRVHAGLAASSVLLTADVQRSRQQAVAAREEERRRIRRDLHDGLGPRLAGLALGIESANALADEDPQQARAMLESLTGDAYVTIDEVRALVHDLRPDALDKLGLLAALRERIQTLAPPGSPLTIVLDAPAALPPLPAAVEVAVFRIALEALTNVVRHAEARHCAVKLRVDDGVELVIEDDGRGFVAGATSGIGLGSMSERAAEVGGVLSIRPGQSGGTRVRVVLPQETVS